MRITLVIHPDLLKNIEHDGTLLRLTIESDAKGNMGVIRIQDDPLITHGFRLQAGKLTGIHLREFE